MKNEIELKEKIKKINKFGQKYENPFYIEFFKAREEIEEEKPDKLYTFKRIRTAQNIFDFSLFLFYLGRSKYSRICTNFHNKEKWCLVKTKE